VTHTMSATSTLPVRPTRSVRRTSGLVLVGNLETGLNLTSGLPVNQVLTELNRRRMIQRWRALLELTYQSSSCTARKLFL
jgi:hypothetical protein